jgi:hypothetical protein
MRKGLFLLFLLAIPAVSGSFGVVSDTLSLDIGTYRFIKFRVTPEQAESTFINIDFAVEPLSTEIEFILISETDYRTGWVGRGEIDTLAAVYAEHGPFSMQIPDFGDFVLIVSNRGNLTPVLVEADISVSYIGSGQVYYALPFGMTLLMSLFAIGVVVAAVLLTVKRLSPGRG